MEFKKATKNDWLFSQLSDNDKIDCLTHWQGGCMPGMGMPGMGVQMGMAPMGGMAPMAPMQPMQPSFQNFAMDGCGVRYLNSGPEEVS